MAMGIGGGGNTGQMSGSSSGSGSTLGALMAHMLNRKPAGPVTPAPSAAPSPDSATIQFPQMSPAPAAAPSFQQRLRSQFGNQENSYTDDSAGMSVKPL